MENQQAIKDWREDITDPKDTLKIADGEIVNLIFLDEGTYKPSVDYGDSVRFFVEKIGLGSQYYWYVTAKNYYLLNQIKALGKPLSGQTVKVKRTGKTRSETRYQIERIVVD